MYSTVEAAELVGVSKNTLLRWISEGRLRDVARDWRNWRIWSDADIVRAKAVRDGLHRPVEAVQRPSPKATESTVYAADLSRLGAGRSYRAG